MKLKNFFICIGVLFACIFNHYSDFEEYMNLDIEDVPSIKYDDLPAEFGDETFKMIDEFIRNTHNLDYEFVIYFDYITGKILKCVKGGENSVEVEFQDNEFEGCHVASIHNHPKNFLSAPSDINFGIFNRGFEDYELIAGFDSFWILKAKGLHKQLLYELNMYSRIISDASLEECISRYSDSKIISKMHDIKYGNQLLNYINNKNINDIQLSKKEYISMDNNTNTAEYHCKKLPSLEEIELARKRQEDPNVLSGKDKVYAWYKMMGMEIDYDEIFAD